MTKETKEKAVQLVTDTLDSFSESTRNVCSMLGGDRAINEVIIPEVFAVSGVMLKGACQHTDQAYAGERRDLEKLFEVDGWADALKAAYSTCKNGNCHTIRSGDYVRMWLKVPAIEIDGCEFEEIDLENTELTVVHVMDGHAFFNFEDVVQYGPMNEDSTTKGGIKASVMAKYLKHVLKYSGIENVVPLVESKDGLKLTLMTKYEIFGDGSYDDVNYPDICDVQFDFFKKARNRIKVCGKEGYSRWYWTATAANANNFVNVNNNGNVNNNNANNTNGGIAPDSVRVTKCRFVNRLPLHRRRKHPSIHYFF